ERKKGIQAQQTSRPAEDISSTTNQLLQTLITAQTQHLAQNLYGGLHSLSAPPSNPPPSLLLGPPPNPLLYALPYALPAPSSPIYSNSDPSKILAQFFDWLIYRSNEQQRELLEYIKDRLLDKDWNLDTLHNEHKGGVMTMAIWESYGFKLGMLTNI
ncbi:MAG: hypothetical protein M1840_001249, partial [Geoglossum simile]